MSRLEISPARFVGYTGDRVAFNALPTNFAGETIQGVRLSWDSSNPDKVEIDDSGLARFIKPGLTWIICRAGIIESRVPVLIRPGRRSAQSDADWDSDQSSLDANGNLVGRSRETGYGLPSLLDSIFPVAQAQNSGGAIDRRAGIHSAQRDTRRRVLLLDDHDRHHKNIHHNSTRFIAGAADSLDIRRSERRAARGIADQQQ